MSLSRVRVPLTVALLVSCLAAIGSPLAAVPPGGVVEGVHGAIPGFPVNSCYVCHDIAPGTTGRDSVQRPNETCLGCHTSGPTFGTGDPYIQDRPNATPVEQHSSLVTGNTQFTYGDFGASWPYPDFEESIHCTTCHDPHRTFDPAAPAPSTQNVKYVRDHTDDYKVLGGLVRWYPYKQIKVVDNSGPTPVTTIKTVDQNIVYTGPADFADGVGEGALEADVCQVCHTLTNHHQVDGTAPGGQSHFDGEDCTSCHSHPDGFGPIDLTLFRGEPDLPPPATREDPGSEPPRRERLGGRVVTSSCSVISGSKRGGGTVRRISSKSSRRSLPSPSGAASAIPSRALQ